MRVRQHHRYHSHHNHYLFIPALDHRFLEDNKFPQNLQMLPSFSTVLFPDIQAHVNLFASLFVLVYRLCHFRSLNLLHFFFLLLDLLQSFIQTLTARTRLLPLSVIMRKTFSWFIFHCCKHWFTVVFSEIISPVYVHGCANSAIENRLSIACTAACVFGLKKQTVIARYEDVNPFFVNMSIPKYNRRACFIFRVCVPKVK